MNTSLKTAQPFNKIAIVGVGLIGGSIGLSIRTRRFPCKVIGVGRRKSSLDKAIQKSAIDKGTLDMQEAVMDADLIIIATPVDKVKQKIVEAARYAKKGAIIIDVNSTKQDIVKVAEDRLPKEIFFVGTHPIAGSEKAGVASSEPELFNNTVCIITPTQHTDKEALLKVRSFWQGLGSRVEYMSAKRHDAIIAKVSHLPHIISYALCNTVSAKELNVAGSGFRDTTRIAKSSSEMWEEIFLQNQKSVLEAIRLFEKNLNSLKSDIMKRNKSALSRKLKTAMKKRASFD
jgi:prephenate dehydrogenase